MIAHSCVKSGRLRNRNLTTILTVLSAIFMIKCSDPGEKLKPEGLWLASDEKYETEIGALKGGFLLQNGNQMRNGKIVSGAIYMDAETAYAIEKKIGVLETKKKLDVEVTLLQDKKSGNWLATQGWLCMKNGEVFLLDNTRVKVIGGKKNPILIDDRPYSNTEMVVRK